MNETAAHARKPWRGAVGLGIGLALALALVVCATAALADPLRLAADLNRDPSGSFGISVRQLTVAGDRVVFVAHEPSSGTELWVSDGTALGTRLLRDLEPGSTSPSDLLLLGSNGQLAFFYVNSADASYGEVWRTDGTDDGTVPLGFGNGVYPFVRDRPEVVVRGTALFIASCEIFAGCELWRTDGSVGATVRLAGGGGISQLEGLAAAGANIYFTALVDGFYELWRSDGTPGATAAVRDHQGFLLSSQLRAAAGLRLVFVADGADGEELWATDGTAAGTVPLTSFAAPSPFESTRFLRTIGERVYFLADDVIGGNDLWRSDGTAAGTHRVTDFGYAHPFAFNLPAEGLAQLGERIVFPATDGLSFGYPLWTSRGTPASVAPITGCVGGCPLLGEEVRLVVTGSRAVFMARNPVSFAAEVWSTDGTGPGTQRLAAGLCDGCWSFTPPIASAGGKAYFVAGDPGAQGLAIWVSDGSPAGTRALAHVGTGGSSSGQPFEVVSVAGNAFFTAFDGLHGPQLWATDGTSAGTAQLSAIGASEASSYPRSLTPLTDRATLFSAGDGTSRPLWVTDGTPAGTSPLAPTQSLGSAQPPRDLTPHGGLVYFTVEDGNLRPQLWRTDGTSAGTLQLTSFSTAIVGELVSYRGQLLLAVLQYQPGDASLWTSDGTVAGTRHLLDLPGVRSPRELTALGDELYFLGTTESSRTSAWRSDGTAAGTRALTPEESWGDEYSSPSFTRLGSHVYFTDSRLWRSDGTSAGTALVFGGAFVPGSYGVTNLGTHGDNLFFFANAELGAQAPALFRSDGTAAGTVELARLTPPREYQNLQNRAELTPLGGRAYFVAADGEHGEELWTTDGTAAGTHLVRDLSAGSASSQPRYLTVAAGRLFFAATDGVHGIELWETDGSAAGTHMVQDLAPGGLSSNPEELTASTGQLLFAADDGVVGTELWTLPLSSSGCQPTAERLCLNGGRYAVEAHWRDFSGHTGAGHAAGLTADTGTFWFFSPENVEVILKVLDGRGVNGHVWVFYGALSSVEYTLTVTDTQTGAARRYVNVSGRLGSVADTVAFGPRGATPSSTTTGPAVAPVITAELSRQAIAPKQTCVASATRLCLNGGRFAVEAHWAIPGSNGAGRAVALTGDTGYLWFFNAENVELVVKVLDGRPVNGKYWVFYGALSDVEYTLTVTDTSTGRVKEYHNPHGRLASAADTAAF